MDGRSHVIFGKVILEKAGLPTEYYEWATAPDIDLEFLHRYARHRFSVIDKIYKEFRQIHPDIPCKNKEAVTLCIVSHFFLDLYNFPIWCWGLPFFASHIPPQLTHEFFEKDKNIYFDLPPEFYSKSERIFRKEIPETSSDALINYFLTALSRHTFLGGRPKKAAKYITKFIGREFEYKPYLISDVSIEYFIFLNNFFKKF